MYLNYFNELVNLCKLIGVSVVGKESQEFDLSTYGNFDPIDRTIHLYYEGTLTISATVLFTLAHEFRHAYQYYTNMHPEFWAHVCGVGPKPDASIKDALEADADEYAAMYLRGRKIRIPKNV